MPASAGGVRGGDTRGDSGRDGGSCAGCGLPWNKSVGGSEVGVEVGSGGDNARGFTVGVLTTTLDSSSLAEAYWRKRHGLEDQRDDRSPEEKSRSSVSAWSTNGTGGRSTSALTSICGGIAPIDSANSVTLLLWLVGWPHRHSDIQSTGVQL